MATGVRLLLPLPPSLPPLGRHVKASMASDTTVITFPYIHKEGDLGDLARDWIEQDRPGEHKPLTRPGGPKLVTTSITALFTDPDDPQRSVEPQLLRLRLMAAAPRPVTVSFGNLMGESYWTTSGRWVIRSLSIHRLEAAHVDNQVTRAEADIGLLEANVPGWTPNPSSDRFVSEIPGAGLGQPGSYTVHDGDTLWSIAGTVLGSPRRWLDIARANGLTDVRDLPAGLVLTLPR